MRLNNGDAVNQIRAFGAHCEHRKKILTGVQFTTPAAGVISFPNFNMSATERDVSEIHYCGLASLGLEVNWDGQMLK